MREKIISRVKRPDGFTLPELLVVVVILGVLAAITIAALGRMSRTSRATAERQDARTLQSAEETYLARHDTNSYATTSQLLADRLLRRPSEMNSICLKSGPAGDYFIVRSVPPTQAEGDAECAARASELGKTEPYLYLASAGSPAMP